MSVDYERNINTRHFLVVYEACSDCRWMDFLIRWHYRREWVILFLFTSCNTLHYIFWPKFLFLLLTPIPKIDWYNKASSCFLDSKILPNQRSLIFFFNATRHSFIFYILYAEGSSISNCSSTYYAHVLIMSVVNHRHSILVFCFDM